MSIAMMAETWKRQISGTEQQVLLVLCDHVQDDGTRCYPSVPLIAWKIGVSDRTVRRVIKSLEEQRVLQVVREDGKSNTYRINLDALPPKEPFRRKSERATPDIAMSPRQNDTPDIAMSPHPGHNGVTPTPDTAMSPKPPVELSRNHQTPNRRASKRSRFDYTDEFEEFWQAYPKVRRLAKAEAFAEWEAIAPDDALRGKIMTAIRHQAVHRKDWKKEGGKYIPHPSRWLKYGRWDDEGDSEESNVRRFVV